MNNKQRVEFIKSSIEYKVIREQLSKRPRTPKELLKCTRRVIDSVDIKARIFDLLSIDEVMWQDGKFRLRGVVTDEDAKEAKEWYAARGYEDMREK